MAKTRIEKKVRGVYEHPAGSGVWWIHYYTNGKRHREKVGRKSDAIDLYRERKAAARRGEKLPELRDTKSVTMSDLADKRNYISKGEIVREQLGTRTAEEITPQELEAWLSKHCKTAATATGTGHFYLSVTGWEWRMAR